MLSAYLELLSDITGYQKNNCFALSIAFILLYIVMVANLVISAFATEEDTPTDG